MNTHLLKRHCACKEPHSSAFPSFKTFRSFYIGCSRNKALSGGEVKSVLWPILYLPILPTQTRCQVRKGRGSPGHFHSSSCSQGAPVAPGVAWAEQQPRADPLHTPWEPPQQSQGRLCSRQVSSTPRVQGRAPAGLSPSPGALCPTHLLQPSPTSSTGTALGAQPAQPTPLSTPHYYEWCPNEPRGKPELVPATTASEGLWFCTDFKHRGEKSAGGGNICFNLIPFN